MLLSRIILAALLVVPSTQSLSLKSPLPITSSTHARRGAATRLSTIAGGDTSANDEHKFEDANNEVGAVTKRDNPLPREMMPITMGVFAQMLGEGIALSSLPLYLTRIGARPTMVGLGISCFSLAQMTFAPILVGLSSRIGRSIVLRICLVGAVASSMLIAFSGNVYGIIAGRTLAGIFAACVPVAQSAVTDILSKEQAALGLSRVAAASQLGIVVGPAISAVFQEMFALVGCPTNKCLPAVFCLNSLFILAIFSKMTLMNRHSVGLREPTREQQKQHESQESMKQSKPESIERGLVFRLAQPILRIITISMGWTAILSNSIYGLFSPKFLNFSQPQLSATYSFAAALMVGTQVILPKLVTMLGEYNVCTMGILAAGVGIGGQSLIRVQPLHSILYMMNRAGAAVADTSTAALVARFSPDRNSRSRNLALLTSTRAAGRVVTPLLSSRLFEMSCRRSSTFSAGALPFVIASCLAIAVSPLPTFLRLAEYRHNRKSGEIDVNATK